MLNVSFGCKNVSTSTNGIHVNKHFVEKETDRKILYIIIKIEHC